MKRAVLGASLLLVLTAYGQERPGNPVDSYFADSWAKQGLTSAAPADDHEFLRRASLDVLGRMPRPDEVRAFERARAAGVDREKKIDELLASREASEYFADTWLRILLDYRADETAPAKMSFPAFRSWLREAYAKDLSYRDFVLQLLSDSGDYTLKPATNYVLVALDPKEPPWELVARSTRVFLGLQIQCARCHDHPTEKLTQKDFWGMAALFSGARPKARTTFDGFGIKLTDEAAVALRIPDTDVLVEPRFLDGQRPSSPATARRKFAECVVSHPQFARVIVNRVWAHFMGKGFVEPLDHFTEGSTPTHPALLDALTGEFTSGGYSLRKLERTILTSRPYQLSSRTVAGAPESAHAYMLLKPQDPVQLLNTLTDALELDVFLKGFYDKFVSDKTLPDSYRNEAVFRMYLHTYTAGLLAPPGTVPEDGRYTGSVRLALKLMNGHDIQALVRAEWGRLKAILEKEKTAEGRLSEIFYTLLGRPPSADEATRELAYLKAKREAPAAYEDIYWTLLNSTELYFNH